MIDMKSPAEPQDGDERGIPRVGAKKKGNRWMTVLTIGAVVVMLLAYGAKGAMDALRHRADGNSEPRATRGLPNLASSAFDVDGAPPLPNKPEEKQLARAAATPVDDLAERRKRAPLLALGGKAASAQPPGVPTGGSADTDNRAGSLGAAMRPTRAASARAYQLKDPDLTLTQGSFIDCTLITAINSTLPGMTACVLSRDVYSTNGRVLLLERGSRLVGQYQSGQLRQGMRRIFLLWTRVETPGGVLVDLDSPATDSLGRSGVDGRINNHFWQRFGAAMLVSVVDDALQSAQQQSQGNTSVSFNNSNQAAQGLAATIVQSTVNIQPTLERDQGSRVGVFVARDIYFGDVYQLRQTGLHQ
jgi:type IV secretion system protein VirB10